MNKQSSSRSGIKQHSLDLGQAIQAIAEEPGKTVQSFFRTMKQEFSYNGVLENLELAGIFYVKHSRPYVYNMYPGPDPEKALNILPGVEPGKALDILLLKSYALAVQTRNKPVQDALGNAIQAHIK